MGVVECNACAPRGWHMADGPVRESCRLKLDIAHTIDHFHIFDKYQ